MGILPILPIILSFSGGSVADSYHGFLPFFVHHGNNIAWAKMNVNRDFLQNPGCDTHFRHCDTQFYVSQCLFHQNGTQRVPFLMRRSTGLIHIQLKVHTKGCCVYLYLNLSHFSFM